MYLFDGFFPPFLVGGGGELVAQGDGAVVVEHEPQHVRIQRPQTAPCLDVQHLFCDLVYAVGVGAVFVIALPLVGTAISSSRLSP